MYKSDDFHPYMYKTTDYGKTWTKIVNGIPDNHFTRVIREDPNRKGCCSRARSSASTFPSTTGENWQPFQLNLPIVPITDLAFHKREKEWWSAPKAARSGSWTMSTCSMN